MLALTSRGGHVDGGGHVESSLVTVSLRMIKSLVRCLAVMEELIWGAPPPRPPVYFSFFPAEGLFSVYG